MATNLVKVPLFRTVVARGYSTAAYPIGGHTCYDVCTKVLPNKLVVASAENGSALSRVSVIFRAGSRHETHDNLGAAHVMRIVAGSATCNASRFAIIRNLQEVGANLSVTSDRELITYTLEGTRDAVTETLPYLSEVTLKQIFNPWDISDNIYRLKLDLATRAPQQRAIDLLHKAAYRTGLGNSLYIAKHQLGKISSETMQHYFKSHFVSGKAAVVGLGIDESELLEFAQSLELESKDLKTAPAQYKGGELRSDKGGNMAYIAIAGEGGALCDSKEALAFAALKYALGAGPQCSWGLNNGPLQKAMGDTTAAAATAFNINYGECGLFGILIAAQADQAGCALKSALKVLKCSSVSESDATKGKNMLKTAILCELESAAHATYVIGTYASILGTSYSPKQIAEAIDCLTPADLNAAAKKVASSNLSIASVGNLHTVPFLDELK